MELSKRNKLIINNMYLVEIQIRKKKASFERDELRSAGYLGLVEAADKYEESKGSFEPYASIRISGAMNDHIHQHCRWGKWIPADVKITSLEECGESALLCYDNQDFEELISPLDYFERKILRWYYVEGLTNKEIGERLGFCESRMSQKLKRIQSKLKLIYNSEE